MQTFRTFFKKEIFADVFVPVKKSTKVLILCDGVPSVPKKQSLVEFFVKKGYIAIHIRYRGTWESKGKFLNRSLNQDILDVIDELQKDVIDLWTKTKYKIQPSKIVLLGSSFGGPAVL